MRRFAIKNKLHKNRPAEAWLEYDEKKNNAVIRIDKNADLSLLPLIPEAFAKKGIYEVDSDWTLRFVRERVVPSSRQNIGAILKAHGLKYYDEYALLFDSKGYCSQDDCYLEEETPETAYRERILKYASLVESVRIAAGLTQAELAQRSGIKQCNLSRIENGKTMPSTETLERIAGALGKQVKVSFI